VQRVVLTSSLTTVYPGHNPEGRIFTEDDWAKADAGIGAYAKSKTLAECAAWDFVNNLPAGKTLELAAINPSLVIGPLLDEHQPMSVEIVRKLLNREVPAASALAFPSSTCMIPPPPICWP
jgi:nucleoside-diphosphate-sugar epimerase